jgi:hypothetical protein
MRGWPGWVSSSTAPIILGHPSLRGQEPSLLAPDPGPSGARRGPDRGRGEVTGRAVASWRGAGADDRDGYRGSGAGAGRRAARGGGNVAPGRNAEHVISRGSPGLGTPRGAWWGWVIGQLEGGIGVPEGSRPTWGARGEVTPAWGALGGHGGSSWRVVMEDKGGYPEHGGRGGGDRTFTSRCCMYIYQRQTMYSG